MPRPLAVLATLALAACALVPNEHHHEKSSPVCVVDVDTGASDCEKAAAETPPESDEPCTVIEQSPTLNHGGPPAVHSFCTPAESAGHISPPD